MFQTLLRLAFLSSLLAFSFAEVHEVHDALEAMAHRHAHVRIHAAR